MAGAPWGGQGPCEAAADRTQSTGAQEPGCKMLALPRCPAAGLRPLLAMLYYNLCHGGDQRTVAGMVKGTLGWAGDWSPARAHPAVLSASGHPESSAPKAVSLLQ